MLQNLQFWPELHKKLPVSEQDAIKKDLQIQRPKNVAFQKKNFFSVNAHKDFLSNKK